MLSQLRSKIIVAASTHRGWASAVGLGMGLWGVVRGRRGSIDHLKSTWSLARRSTTIAGRPMNITIEQTNVCNLDCPVCETGAGILGRTAGHLTLDKFKIIIDKVGAHTNTLMFYFMGEPFLNKHSYDMIRYAKAAGIPFVETCTNGDFVDPLKLVESGIDRVSFQIGGLTQETHEQYRVKGVLERSLRNLKETIRIRDERGAKMQIEVGFILMKHNEHEADRFRQEMLALGADRTIVIDPCVRTIEQGLKFLPTDRKHWIYDEAAFEQGRLRPKILPDNVCPWIHYSMAIHVNGNVVPCCRDPRGTEVMGNIFTQSLDEIWNGAKYRDLRERVMRDQGSVDICRLCSSYPVSKIN
ncbi:MAG TPA: radical SAM protein [Vicinamibacterales bacterium]|nr:radical SAM protein [Vicinamibacterales bacterium]